MQKISFGGKLFDDFDKKLQLENMLKQGYAPRQIAITFGCSHQVVRDEICKGIENEIDFLKRQYEVYSAGFSRQQDIKKIMLLVEQFEQELSAYNQQILEK